MNRLIGRRQSRDPFGGGKGELRPRNVRNGIGRKNWQLRAQGNLFKNGLQFQQLRVDHERALHKMGEIESAAPRIADGKIFSLGRGKRRERGEAAHGRGRMGEFQSNRGGNRDANAGVRARPEPDRKLPAGREEGRGGFETCK